MPGSDLLCLVVPVTRLSCLAASSLKGGGKVGQSIAHAASSGSLSPRGDGSHSHRQGRTETFFSDQKSRGCHLHKSHLSDPMHLSGILIVSCLAYIWIIYLVLFYGIDRLIRVIYCSDRFLFKFIPIIDESPWSFSE